MKADRNRTAKFLIMLTLIISSQRTGAQSLDPTAALPPRRTTSPTEVPQVIRDGPVELRLECSSLAARIAEPIYLSLVLDAPEGSNVTMPMVGAALGPLEVVDRRSINALPIDGDPARRRWTFQLTLESIESGALTVPSMEFLYRLPEDSLPRSPTQSIRSLPFTVEVATVLDANQDLKAFRDIKEAMETPTPRPTDNVTWWIVSGFALTSLALLGGVWWWRRDRTPIPHDWACAEIAAIDDQLASHSISPSDAYAKLCLILRQFLEHELGFPATAMSSSELSAELNARSFPPPTVARLTQFLSEADEVKFSGRQRPRAGLSESPTSCVRDIVQQVHRISVANGQEG